MKEGALGREIELHVALERKQHPLELVLPAEGRFDKLRDSFLQFGVLRLVGYIGRTVHLMERAKVTVLGETGCLQVRHCAAHVGTNGELASETGLGDELRHISGRLSAVGRDGRNAPSVVEAIESVEPRDSILCVPVVAGAVDHSPLIVDLGHRLHGWGDHHDVVYVAAWIVVEVNRTTSAADLVSHVLELEEWIGCFVLQLAPKSLHLRYEMQVIPRDAWVHVEHDTVQARLWNVRGRHHLQLIELLR